jgi:glycosyltransferase involved in cell wall biosynthesis
MSTQADYRKISVSLIATVFNEKNNISDFLKSYQKQSLVASEFIIVDAFSNDGTDKIIAKFAKQNLHLKIKIFQRKSNRAQARNFAVSKTIGEYLAFTDAGCLLDPFWLHELVNKQLESKQKVVGGFFQGIAKNILQEAIVPYFLQLNKRVDKQNFVPTTRSLIIEKELWQSLGGLNEKLELSEDYDLMLRIKDRKISIAFAKKAIVYWYPPTNFIGFISKIAAFATSDIEAGIIRPKVISIYFRYLFLLLLFLIGGPIYFFTAALLYLLWSIYKNYHNCPHSWFYLPLLQLSSDGVIMVASFLALPRFRTRAF